MNSSQSLGHYVAFVVLLLWVQGVCAQTDITPANSSLGLQRQGINVDGTDRSYYIHFPPMHESSSQLPLVLALHGGGKGDGLTFAKYLEFTSLADSQGFVVAYPNGIDSYWRDGRGYTHRGVSDTTVDDVGFISQLIDHLVREHNLDPKRIYVTGMSNGGMMTLRLGGCPRIALKPNRSFRHT